MVFGLPCPCPRSTRAPCGVRAGLLALPWVGARPAPPLGDTWRLGYLPLRWVRPEHHGELGLACQGRPTRPARHVARPSAWAALHVHLHQDPMVMARCQDPIRLGPAPRPNGNGFCGGPKSNGSCLKTQFAWVLTRTQIISVINIL